VFADDDEDDDVNVGNFGLNRLMRQAARETFITFIRNKVHIFTHSDIYLECTKGATIRLIFCRRYAALFLHVKAGATRGNRCWAATQSGRNHCSENINYFIWST